MDRLSCSRYTVDYIEPGFLKYLNGNINYELRYEPGVANYRYILTRRVQYRIQFGYTQLK